MIKTWKELQKISFFLASYSIFNRNMHKYFIYHIKYMYKGLMLEIITFHNLPHFHACDGRVERFVMGNI
jgi:hypothetical protein